MFQNVLGRLTKSKKGKSAPVITTEHNESDINNFTVDKQNDSEKKNKSILIPKSKNEKKDKKSKKKNEKKENKKSKKRKSKDSGPDQKENFSQSNESSSDGSNSISHSDAHAARSEQDGNKRGSKASSKDDDVRHSVGVAFDHQGNVKLLGKDGTSIVYFTLNFPQMWTPHSPYYLSIHIIIIFYRRWISTHWYLFIFSFAS